MRPPPSRGSAARPQSRDHGHADLPDVARPGGQRRVVQLLHQLGLALGRLPHRGDDVRAAPTADTAGPDSAGSPAISEPIAMISASEVRPAFRSRSARADRSAATAVNAAATSSGVAATLASPTTLSATIRSMPAAVPADTGTP